MIVVSDTSSISNLFQIGLIEILYKLYGEITITPAVQRELYAIATQEIEIEKIAWIKVITPSNQKLILQLLDELDLGESESIALAIEKDARYLIIDEFKGRVIADKYGVKIVGVLGVLIQAKQNGLISSVKEYTTDLRNIGFRLDKNLVQNVLRKLNEI